MFIKRDFFWLTIIGAFLQITPAIALDSQAGKASLGWSGCYGTDDWNAEHLREQMIKHSATSVSVPNRSTSIVVQLDRGRVIETPLIKESSGNAQFDFDCLQAVLSDSGGSHTISGKVNEIFSSSELRGVSRSQSAPSKELVFYIVPLSLYDRFGAGRFFSREELLGPDNMDYIPNTSRASVSKKAADTLKKIYCDRWVPLIGEGCQPTLDQIMITRQQIRRDLEREKESKMPLMK